jgi:hypothetical protein
MEPVLVRPLMIHCDEPSEPEILQKLGSPARVYGL